jgi:pimeloyl-ACP methyl ester carboxylesterase
MTQQFRTSQVSGGGGVALFVEETGNPSGRPVLFLHGLSQCRLAWERQLRSDLGRDLRLVAVDLRGHGRSEKPQDGYGDSALWAADVHAVITSLELDRPILCGWSYGGVVIGDYLSRYGEATVGGIALVGAVSRLGEPALPFLGADFLATLPGLFSTDLQASTAALRTFIHLTTSADPAPEDLYRTLGYNVVVPPQVRQAMLSRTLTHDDLLKELTIPVLVAHGSDDEIILPAMAEHHGRLIPHAKTAWYQGIGHSPFLEAPDQFNADLRAFAASV